MDNCNRYLGEQMIKEAIRGGPAYYRPAHLAANPQAQQLAQLDEDKPQAKCRLLSLKLPGLPPLRIRLPKWALIGEPSA